MRPFLSLYARRKKIDYFIRGIPKESRILEIGCGDGWLREYFKSNGYAHYRGMDIVSPSEITGDIRTWRELGIREESFDVIIAFEVIEHVDCLEACYSILRKGGRLLVTTPVPRFDLFLRFLERIGLNQQRGTPHNNLIYLDTNRYFKNMKLKRFGFFSQWGILTK